MCDKVCGRGDSKCDIAVWVRVGDEILETREHSNTFHADVKQSLHSRQKHATNSQVTIQLIDKDLTNDDKIGEPYILTPEDFGKDVTLHKLNTRIKMRADWI